MHSVFTYGLGFSSFLSSSSNEKRMYSEVSSLTLIDGPDSALSFWGDLASAFLGDLDLDFFYVLFSSLSGQFPHFGSFPG